MSKKLIAIDFDDTITEYSPYPIMGKIREDAKIYIKKLYDLGYTLALWTCRDTNFLAEAMDALDEAGIIKYFTYINDDGHKPKFVRRKIVADFYIDDKSIMGAVDWKQIYEYIVTNIKLED